MSLFHVIKYVQAPMSDDEWYSIPLEIRRIYYIKWDAYRIDYRGIDDAQAKAASMQCFKEACMEYEGDEE
jgi:hypothetical protein